MHAFPAAHHMLVKCLAGAGSVTGGDLVHDVAMLARGYRKRPVLGEGLAPEKIELVDQPSVGREQLSVASKRDQALVKVQVQRVIGIDIVLRRGAIHALDDRSQCLELFRGRGSREASPDPFVERSANLVDFVGFLDAEKRARAEIVDHKGAVAMVKTLMDTYGAAQDDVIYKFASDVFADQSIEIGVMQKMLNPRR